MQSTKNVIAIDPSTTCTGLCVNSKLFCFVDQSNAKTKKGSLKKWFDVANEQCQILAYDAPSGLVNPTYSESESHKLTKYDFITDKIVDIIEKEVDISDSICLIEGYSYSSAAGKLIDLVTFSTLLRYKLAGKGSTIKVIAPTSLKTAAAKLTYPTVNVNEGTNRKEKLEWRNNEGISGGSFTKHDMYKAIVENCTLTDNWIHLLREHQSDHLNAASIPKPFDDVNDSYLLYQTYLAGHLNN